MSGTAIGSFSDFLNWNGNGDAYLTASFTVTDLQTPIAITSAIGFNGQGNTITIDVSTTFQGLFDIQANVIPTFQNMVVNVSETTMTNLETYCGCVLAYNGTYNPQASFLWCSVTLGGSLTGYLQGAYIGAYDQQKTGQFTFTQCKASIVDVVGTRCGGFVGGYLQDVAASNNRFCTFTFTKCYVSTGYLINTNTAGFCGKLHSSTISFDQCIVNCVFSSTNHSKAGFFTAEHSVTASITNSYVLFQSYRNTNSWWDVPAVTAFFRWSTSTLTVSNIYALPLNNSIGYITEYNYRARTSSTTNSDGDYGVSLTNCAFPPSCTNFLPTYNATYSNVIYTYTATSASNTSPFTNFNLSTIWSSVTSTSPLILQAFTQSPFSNYTVYDSSVTSVPCFLEGTRLLLADGVTWKPVEELHVGDILHVNAIIKNISISYVTDDSSDPICIPRHFFGENTPWKDLYLSPWHAILHPLTGKWVHAQHLQNTACHDKKPVFVYYMIETTRSDDLVNANGIQAETFGPPHLWDCDPQHETCIRRKKIL